MLTRDLIRTQKKDGRIVPRFLKATPAMVELADDLLALYRDGRGRERDDLADEAAALLHRTRSLLVGKGLHKLVVDACTFAEPTEAVAWRTRVLDASAALMATPAASEAGHLAALAMVLEVEPAALAADLYADLPGRAKLERAPAMPAATLIDDYNLALAQGILLGAQRLDLTIADGDAGARRRLLKALRWRRLLAEVRQDERGLLRLTVSGPAAIFDQGTRYGLQLALFLPVLACCRQWWLSAPVSERGGETAVLELSHLDGLRGITPFTGFVPPEYEVFAADWAARQPGWALAEAPLRVLPGGDLVVPDFRFVPTDGGAPRDLELFHRWHAAPLRARLDQLAAGLLPGLGLGVDRSLAKLKEAAPLMEHPAFATHGFLFSDLPNVRGVAELLGRANG